MGKSALVGVVLGAAFCLSACQPQYNVQKNSADRRQRAETEQMAKQAHRKIGMPGISNFTERRFAKMIAELRDEEIGTFTYIVDMNGRLHFVCESIGYGLPYSVQFTNPAKPEWKKVDDHTGISVAGVAVGQPEPNGLFMPGGLDATWILCADEEEGVKPFYSEPKLLVSPYPLHAASSYQLPDGDGGQG